MERNLIIRNFGFLGNFSRGKLSKICQYSIQKIKAKISKRVYAWVVIIDHIEMGTKLYHRRTKLTIEFII
jgi:hypothetical protein